MYLNLLLLAITFASSCLCQKSDFYIEKTWDGDDIDHEDPLQRVHIHFDSNDGGDLTVQVSAPYFNSPHFPPDLLTFSTCPRRTVADLYNYEVTREASRIGVLMCVSFQVVGVFLANDDDEYLEIEFSPHGSYLLIMLDGYRNKILEKLPLFPSV